MNDNLHIRAASESDAEALLAIYAPYVRETAITFEYDVPTVEEFARRIRRTLERYPYLVAEESGAVAGYAYAGAFQSRPAYGWGAEVTVYVERSRRRGGVGRALYEALERAARAQGILNLNACIASPSGEDDYLTADSEAFHARMGYELVGRFHRCGHKFDRWYDMVWMEKLIGEHLPRQSPVIPFPELENRLAALL